MDENDQNTANDQLNEVEEPQEEKQESDRQNDVEPDDASVGEENKDDQKEENAEVPQEVNEERAEDRVEMDANEEIVNEVAPQLTVEYNAADDEAPLTEGANESDFATEQPEPLQPEGSEPAENAEEETEPPQQHETEADVLETQAAPFNQSEEREAESEEKAAETQQPDDESLQDANQSADATQPEQKEKENEEENVETAEATQMTPPTHDAAVDQTPRPSDEAVNEKMQSSKAGQNPATTELAPHEEYDAAAATVQDVTEHQTSVMGVGGAAPPPLDQTPSGDVLTVRLQQADGKVETHMIEIVRAKRPMPFLGGYRHRKTGVEYRNASIQTLPKPRPPPVVDLFTRETQTHQMNHIQISTKCDTSTQMTRPGVYVANLTDKYMVPGKYESADDREKRIIGQVIILQKYYRRWLAKRKVAALRQQRDDRLAWEASQHNRKFFDKDKNLAEQFQRRMHPRTREDFNLLYNALEKWRQEELVRINTEFAQSAAERKAALCQLLDQETELLAAIDRHRIESRRERDGAQVKRLLGKAASPKTWQSSVAAAADRHQTIQMDTPFTIRARELLDIHTSLQMKYVTQDERLDVLLTLKHTVREHRCRLTADLVELIDREADLLMRDVPAQQLAGLRKRIATLFLQYCRTPAFNPEISRLLPVPQDPLSVVAAAGGGAAGGSGGPAGGGAGGDPKFASVAGGGGLIGDVHFCKSCSRYLRQDAFELSSKSRHMGVCRNCKRKDNEARERQDLTHFKAMLTRLREQETERNLSFEAELKEQYGGGGAGGEEEAALIAEQLEQRSSKIAFLVKETDIRHMVESIWDGKSVLSSVDDLADLQLARWHEAEPWSPWNTILLSHDEADVHRHLENPQLAYSSSMVDRVRRKHFTAYSYFYNLEKMGGKAVQFNKQLKAKLAAAAAASAHQDAAPKSSAASATGNLPDDLFGDPLIPTEQS